MHLDKALSQISEIHAQVLKAEVFRGYRAATMLATAAVAILAALLQTSYVQTATALQFTGFWVGVAVFCALICSADIYWKSLRINSASQRWLTILVVAQSLPALLVGAVVTGVLLQRGTAEHLLPGLWATTFALGIWSARPYLPKAVGWVALFYVFAGTWLLVDAQAPVPSPWGMGFTFGVGQCALALVLYMNVERRVSLPGGLFQNSGSGDGDMTRRDHG